MTGVKEHRQRRAHFTRTPDTQELSRIVAGIPQDLELFVSIFFPDGEGRTRIS